MKNIYQKTISKSVSFKGVGLHSGKTSKVNILPGTEETGIVFKRVDLTHNNTIPANFKNVSSTTLSTTLQNKYGVKVSTVEHLLAALYIAGIDSAIIEVDNEEIPIMDGSAKDFLQVLRKTNIYQLNKKIKFLKVLDKVKLEDGNRKIQIVPNENFEVDFELKYENQIIGNQRNLIKFDSQDLKEVEESRTFCLYKDIQKIKKMGLAKGGTLENAIVVDDSKVLNEGGLRNQKEFVNHKILDLAGDFLLSGYRILGSVYCYQGGHQLSNLFLQKLLKAENKFEIIEFDKKVVKENKNLKPHLKLVVNA
jgi:UDP-3-O-[3-hydroxymyristoyl] N-acetylglucosamine deacetylase